MEGDDFWKDHRKSGQVAKKLELLKKEKNEWENLKKDVKEAKDFCAGLEEVNEEEVGFIQKLLREIENKVKEIEKDLMYNGEYDNRDAFLSIHAGAGGFDAQDWAGMLQRMYLRYFEKKGYSFTIIDETRGSEAGIKSSTIQVAGKYAYGNLKSEAGVHRLVRLSPFNADNLRQTSFALVEVVPEVFEDSEIEIGAADIRIDTFRSSGAGGQSVNKTDSAVRITHLLTGLVVSCQSERSQAQNKERAMQVLKSKLLKLKQEDKKRETDQLKGEHKTAAWGNQIRSYVLHPYQMVKDHRTNYETSDTAGVLDGNLDEFVQAYLRENF